MPSPCDPKAVPAYQEPARALLKPLLKTLALLLAASCGGGSGRLAQLSRTKPPVLGRDGSTTYQAYLAAAPRRFKMRHQVAATFGNRTEVISGALVMDRPDRFRVRAMAMLGMPLFDVQSEAGKPIAVQAFLNTLTDGRLPHYLARDIHRIYIALCPPDTETTRTGDDIVVRCSIPPFGERIAGDEGPDDAVELRVSRHGLLQQKCFYRRAAATACITYDDHREVSGRWLAHRIRLVHKTLPYEVSVALVSADFDYDTTRAFTKNPE